MKRSDVLILVSIVIAIGCSDPPDPTPRIDSGSDASPDIGLDLSGQPDVGPNDDMEGGSDVDRDLPDATDDADAANSCPDLFTLPPNEAPVVFWPRPVAAYPDVPLDFPIIAYDPNNDRLRYSVSNAPDGMDIDASGNIAFTADAGDLNAVFDVVAQVQDGRGGSTDRPFSLTVTTDGFYFVDPTGDDDNSGAIGSPFLTIERGMEQLTTAGGGTLFIRAGEYDTTWNWERDGVRAPLRGAFAADNPAIVRGFPGENVIINAAGGHGLWAFGNSYVLFADIEVRGATADERGGAMASGDHIVFHNLTVRDSDFSASNNCTGFKLSGIEVVAHQCAGYDNYDRTDSGVRHNNSNYLVYTDIGEDPDQHVYILDSQSSGSIGVGYKIKHAGVGRLSVHGVIDEGSATGFAGADDGLSVQYSTFVDNETGVFVGITDPSAYTLSDMVIRNNTVVGFQNRALSFQDGYAVTDIEFARNVATTDVDLTQTQDESPNMYRIFPYDDAYDLSGITFDENCLWAVSTESAFRAGRSYTNFAGWQAMGEDTNSVLSDPAFIESSYIPNETSGCFSIGVEIGAHRCQ